MIQSSDESDDEETFPKNSLSQSQLYRVGLKPALDNIFAEVQANIPVICSDSDSELNSDEEPEIFNRSGDLISLTPSEDLTDTFKESFQSLSNESQIKSHERDKDKIGTTLSSISTDSGVSITDLNDTIAEQTTSEENLLVPSPLNQTDPSTANGTDKPEASDSSSKAHPTETASHFSSDAIQLNFAQLADIDFSSLMNQVNDVTVPLWPDIYPLDSDHNNNTQSDSDDSSSSSEELMRQLVNLTQKQKGEAVACSKSNTSTSDYSQNVISGTKTVDSGIQAGLYNDTGTMAKQTTASVGVSASFCLSSNTFGDQRFANKTTSQERGTIFIDVRNQQIEPRTTEKKSESVSSSIQRILGIKDEESSSSSSDDENDMELWHEQRRRIKHGIAMRNSTAASSRTTAHKGTGNTKESSTKQTVNPSQLKKNDVNKTVEFTPFEEKQSTDNDKKNIKIPQTDQKEQSRIEQNYILVNKHISPTETVAEFVLIPSPEFDRLAAESKRLRDSAIIKESAKRNLEKACVQAQAKDKNIRLDSQKTKPVIKPEEKLAVQVKSPKQVEKQANKPVKHPVQQDIKPVRQETRKIEECSNNIKPSKLEGDKDAKINLSMKQLEQQKVLNEKLKAKKSRIKQRLESVKRERETRSVAGRVGIAAPQTPVVYDMDASYETAPMTLPVNYANKHYLHLSIPLPACGELSQWSKNLGSGKVGGKGAQAGQDVHAFSLLVAWLLSLVPIPEKTFFVDFADVCESPFYVIGLQQTWHEGELSIKIGICSRDNFQPGRTKQSGRGNAFQSAVAKFLKTNTLCSVLTKLSSYPSHLIDSTIGNKNLSSLLVVNSDPNAMIRVFGGEPGFYWKTLEVEDTIDTHYSNIEYCGPEINNTMMMIQYEAFHDPSCMFDVLHRVWQEGLDLAGIRLLYTNNIPLEERPGLDQSTCNVFPREGPVLTLAIRGPDALYRWLEVVGPNDVWLARRTNPNSLRVIYSNDDKEDHLFYCPRHSGKANAELARWFGGRVPPGDTLNIGSDDVVAQRPRSGSRGRKDEQLPTSALHTPLPSPPCTLVASTESLVIIVTSPLILPRCFGVILAVCFSRGFALNGIRRIRFYPAQFKDSNRDALGLCPAQISVFCPFRTYAEDLNTFTYDLNKSDNSYPFSAASTLFYLRRENGFHHSASLVRVLTEELARVDFLPCDVIARGQTSAIRMCFAVSAYSDHFANVLGSKMKQMPNSSMYAAASLSHSFYSNPELEQVCVLTLLKEKATKHCHSILDCLTLNSPRVTDMMHEDDERDYCGFELLGIKLVTSMTLHQAKEFTPYEIGEKLWQSSLKPLTSGPALIIAIRGINAFERLREFVHSFYGCSPRKRPQQNKEGTCPDMFMAPTPEIAYRQLTAIFFEHELYADYSKRSNLHFLPREERDATLFNSNTASPNSKQKGKKSGRGTISSGRGHSLGEQALFFDDAPIISKLLAGPRPLNTVCIIKPDAVPRYVGKVLKRIAREGFLVVNMRMDMLPDGDAMAVVTRDWECSKADVKAHVSHLTSGPCLVLSIQRENAVGKLLEVLGPGSPEECRLESQFYLRGSYGTDNISNALYGSCSYKDAVKDHKLLFAHGVCCSPTDELKSEEIPCLASDKTFSVDHQRSLVNVPEDLETIPNTGNDEAFTTLLPPSLLELNCLLLLPFLLRSQGSSPTIKQTPGFIEIIDGLITAGAQLVGVRMLRFNDSQAAHCARMYSDTLSSDMKPYQLASHIAQGPCLVVAILRDGAVTSFDTLLGNSIKSNSLASKYGKYVLAAKSFKKARSLLECFFESLMPNKKAQIQSSR